MLYDVGVVLVVVELTQEVPFQYWPEGQVILVVEGEVVELTQELPFQYWPEGQVVVVELTQEVPFQYWSEGQVVVVELTQDPAPPFGGVYQYCPDGQVGI